MIKLMVRGVDPRSGNPKNLCVIGLEQGNFDRLKAGEPILFNLKDIGFSTDCEICIAYKRYRKEKRVKAVKSNMVFVLTDHVIAGLKSGNIVEVDLAYRGKPLCTAMISYVKSKDEFVKNLIKEGMLSPHTVVRHEGFAPSEIQPSMN